MITSAKFRVTARRFRGHDERGLPLHRSVIAFLILAVAGILLAAQTRRDAPSAGQPFSVVEATIPEMQAAMEQHRITSREIVLQYLARIATYEDKLNAVITVNPKALEEAEARDRERAQGTDPRAAARHPDRAQGQHPHDRHADDGRGAGVRRPRASLRGDAHEEPTGCGSHHYCEDDHDRARQLGRGRDAGQLQRARGVRPEPVRSAP